MTIVSTTRGLLQLVRNDQAQQVEVDAMSDQELAGSAAIEIKLSINGLSEMEALRQAPEVTHVFLDWADVADASLNEIVRHPNIRHLEISNLRPSPEQFAILAKLPPGACVKLFGVQDDYPEWAAFRRRRIAQVARLDPEARQRAARRFALGIDDRGPWHPGPTSLRIQYGDARDDDLRLLKWLPELEDLEFSFAWGLTSASLRHLSRLKRLKSLTIHDMRFTTGTLRPLAGCASLWRLRISSNSDEPANDGHTDGLERLTGLRQLELDTYHCADATVERVGHLRGLRHLEITMAGLGGPGCLRALGQLTHLRTLHLVAGQSDAALRHLANLKRLNELEILIDSGNADGLRHLTGLRSLRYLRLTGWEALGKSLQHLERLPGLLSLQVGSRAASIQAARRLAAAVPYLTIRKGSNVIRAPRPTTRFRRVAKEGFASVLIPRRWSRINRQDATRLTWIEEGFERFRPGWWNDGSEALPAQLTLSIDDLPAVVDAIALLQERAIRPLDDARLNELAAPARPDLAFGTANGQVGKSLIAIATSGRRAAVLDCAAPSKRFPDLLGLFRFVAASLRAGPGGGEREDILVEVNELA